jgi:hypothetical protein
MVNSSTTVSAYKLAEGTVISTEKIDDAQISCTIEQFGNAKALWDLTELTAINGTVEETVKELADQANNIVDRRIIEAALGTSATPWGGSGFSMFAWNTVSDTENMGLAMSVVYAAVGTTEYRMKAETVRASVKKLLSRNVKPLDDGFFALVCHSDTAMQLQADSEWQTAYQYGHAYHYVVKYNDKIFLNSGELRKDNPDPRQNAGSNDHEQTTILELHDWNGTWRRLCDSIKTTTQKLRLKNQPLQFATRLSLV